MINSSGYEALFYYHFVYSLDLKTNIEPIAKKKIDSLLPIFQKSNIKSWEGKWNLKQLKTNQFSYEKIIIADKIISFYNKEDDKLASRIEIIKSASYNPNEIGINVSSVLFKNNKIWEFNVKKVGNELRLFPNLKIDVNGESYILLDHRAIIRDSIERKKALAKEIMTYYISEK